ncbi:MAG: ABC transporter transmembrane domain-containing protein [Saccharofermentanales bacterium]
MTLFRQLIRKRMSLIFFTTIICLAASVVSLWWNFLLSKIIDVINTGNSIAGNNIILAAVIIIISMGISYSSGIFTGWTVETLTHDLRMGYARNISILPIDEIENINTGEHASKLQNEISEVSGYIKDNLFAISDDFIRFIATLIWMLLFNSKVTILSHLPLIFMLWYAFFSSKIISEKVSQSQNAKARMNGYTDTLASTFPILRIYNATQFMCNKYNESVNVLETANIKEERIRAKLMSLSAMMAYVPLLLILLIGGSQVIGGKMTLGTLYVFVNLTGNLSGAMMNMPARIAGFRRFSINMKRLEPSILLSTERKTYENRE